MLPDIHTLHDRPSHWRTAGILCHSDARRFVGRLTSSEIEHYTSLDGNFIRISVRYDDLERALSLRPDSRPNGGTSARSPYYHTCLRAMICLPLGGFAGTLYNEYMGIEWRYAPPLCAFAFLLVAEILSVAWTAASLAKRG